MHRKTFQIGRLPACDLVADDPGVSKRHANLTLGADGDLFVADLGSSNGTFVVAADGTRTAHRQGRVPAAARVAFGPGLEIGVTELVEQLRAVQRAHADGRATPRTLEAPALRRPVRCTDCGALKAPGAACPNCGADTSDTNAEDRA